MKKNLPLGEFVAFAALDLAAQEVVSSAWDAALRAFCFRSNFPVGSAVLAENASGDQRIFSGCNVENDHFPATICGERNAGSTAVAEGFTSFKMVALACRKVPGGSPCGLCRQFLGQFGRDAVMLCICDSYKSVRRCKVGDLLPAAKGKAKVLTELSTTEQRLVRRVSSLKKRSYVPYSKEARGAVFIASNAAGKTRTFSGVTSDNAAYGASMAAENASMGAARTAGFTLNGLLVVTVKDVHGVNPIDGECLQVLREFGPNAPVMLVGEDNAVLRTCLIDLLPDSFGPESL